MLTQLIESFTFYLVTFLIIFSFAFLMFRRIDKFEQNSRHERVKQASQDFLTGLKNRQYLRLAESSWIDKRERPFAVFFIDLDNSKNINDSHGHSYGDILLKGDGQSFEVLFSAADTAMYQAKNVKNSFNIFSGKLREQLMETTYIQQSLPRALTESEFTLVYQPQVVDSSLPIGVEALIRWHHEEKGLIPPDRFVPVAEGNGMLIDLGCNLQQGYYFCKPVKLDQLIKYCEQTSWTFE